MIIPKQIAGYIGHRWPDGAHNLATKSYIEGATDKVWLPSATELNIANATDWNGHVNDSWTTPSDESGSTVFEYFKDLSGDTLTNALKATRTPFAINSFAMNFSIPVYNKGTTTVNSNIHSSKNSTDNYWTRSPSSYAFAHARLVMDSGLFSHDSSYSSGIGVRPCVILKY